MIKLSEQIKQKWPMRMDYLINQVSDLEKDRDRLREELKEANSGAAYQAGKQDGDMQGAVILQQLADFSADRQKWRSRMGLKTTDDVVKENNRLREALLAAKGSLPNDANYNDPWSLCIAIIDEALEETT